MTECIEVEKTALCSDRKIKCAKWFCYSFSVFISIFLVISLSGCGCGGKKGNDSAPASMEDDVVDQAAAVSRMKDKQYVEALDTHREDQIVVARERNKLAAEKEACAERVKATLPADATQEDFDAALEKDEEWQRLEKEQDLRDKDVDDVLREARETVKERMLKGMRETKAPAGS